MIGGMLQQLRWRWFLATRATTFATDYLDLTYRIYLNHDKVIHYRDGYAVRSLSTPAVMSKPAANFMARTMYRTIQNRNMPNLMSFAINDICNVSCEHCSFFDGVEERGRPVLSLAQAQKVIRDATDLGVSILNFVGGEPLLRKDLPDLIRAVDKDLTTTVLFTNGSLLSEKAGQLRHAGLDSVYVSLDAADPERHDRFRHADGLFEKAIGGIRTAKAVGLSVGISCTVTPESFASGELQRVIDLGKRLGVHEVIVFDAMPSGRYRDRDDLVDNDAWVDRIVEVSRPYNADPSYPGVLVWAYVSSHKSAGCSCGASYLYVSPYGDVMSCDFNHAKFGNVLNEPLYRIWDRMSTEDGFSQAKWGGCKIKDSGFRSRPTVAAGLVARSRNGSQAMLTRGPAQPQAAGAPGAHQWRPLDATLPDRKRTNNGQQRED